MTEQELELVLQNHEERLGALEEAAGIAPAAEAEDNPREAAHQRFVRRIHGEER